MTVEFIHYEQDWTRREYERPEIDINRTTPECPEHQLKMQLHILHEPAVPHEQMCWQCPECSRTRWTA